MSEAASARPVRTGLFPGTFDPATIGHLDLIRRSARLVDRLIVGVAANPGKGPLFSLEERVGFLREEIRLIQDTIECPVEVHGFDGLLVEFAHAMGARTLFRGLRAVADFDYEVQMFGMNNRLAPSIDTVFLVASERNRFVASRLVKEIARLGGDVSIFLPPYTLERTLERMRATAGDLS